MLCAGGRGEGAGLGGAAQRGGAAIAWISGRLGVRDFGGVWAEGLIAGGSAAGKGFTAAGAGRFGATGVGPGVGATARAPAGELCGGPCLCGATGAALRSRPISLEMGAFGDPGGGSDSKDRFVCNNSPQRLQRTGPARANPHLGQTVMQPLDIPALQDYRTLGRR